MVSQRLFGFLVRAYPRPQGLSIMASCLYSVRGEHFGKLSTGSVEPPFDKAQGERDKFGSMSQSKDSTLL